MFRTHSSIVCLVLAVAGAFVLSYWRGGTPTGAVKELPDLDAVIDHSGHTYDPVISDLYVRAARALEASDSEAAEAVYREAISKYPKDPDGYAALGACLFGQKEYDDAEAEYRRALKLKPAFDDALYGLGCIAFQRGQYSEARNHLLRALALNDGDGLCHRLLGMVYEKLGDRSQAIVHYERAITLAHTVGDVDDIKRWLTRLKN